MDVLKDKELEAYRAERRIFVKEMDAVSAIFVTRSHPNKYCI